MKPGADNRRCSSWRLARFGEEIETANPSDWPGYPDQLRRARTVTGARHAVTTGVATIGGEPCVLAGFEFGFLGGSMGAAEGARITRAFSVAAAERLPIVCVSASGGSRMHEGTSALLQMQAVAAAIAGTRRAGIPHIAVAGDPTTGGVWSSLIADADVLISVPGARVSFSGSRTRPPGADPQSPEYLADRKWARGFIDVLSPVPGLRAEVAAAVRLLSPRTRGDIPRRAPLPAWPAGDSFGDGAPGADAWTHVGGARRPGRARADRWLAGYFGPTVEIRGDRCGGVDGGLRCGFGRHQGTTIAYAAQTCGSAQDGYLAVTTPELATSILKLGVDDVPQVATWLRLTPAELMSRGIVRGIIRPRVATASVAGQAADPR